MRKRFKWLAFIVGVLPALLLMVLAWLLLTESAAKVAMRAATATLSGLEIDNVNGRIIGPLQLRGLRYRSKTLDVTLATAKLEWRFNKLLVGELVVDQLALIGLQVVSRGAPAEAESTEPLTLPQSLPLPITITINDASLAQLEYRSGDENEPFLIDKLHLQGMASSLELTISKLSVQAPAFELDGSAKTQLWKKYQTKAAIDWRVNLAQDGDVKGSFTANGNRGKLDFEIEATAEDTRYGHYTLVAPGYLNESKVVLENWILGTPQSSAQLQLGGTLLELQSEPKIDVALNWQDLQWPLVDSTKPAADTTDTAVIETYTVRSAQGRMNFLGTLSQYEADLHASISTPQTPSGAIDLQAAGNSDSINLQSVNLQALKGTANGNAQVAWGDSVNAAFEFEGQGLDPGELDPQWPGELAFAVRGAVAGETVTLQRITANGQLRERALELNAIAHYDGTVATIEQFSFHSGRTVATAQGVLGDASDFEWDIKSPNLGALYPDLTGSLVSSGRLGGQLSSPAIEAVLAATALRFKQYRVAQLDLNVDLDLRTDDPAASSLRLNASEVVAQDSAIENIEVTADGTRQDHQISLQVNAVDANILADFSGGLEESSWLGKLESATITVTDVAPWNLTEPHSLALSEQAQSLGRSCWASAEAQLCLGGKRAGAILQAELQLQALTFNSFQPFMPPDVAITGSISGDANFHQQDSDNWSANAQLATTAATLSRRATKDEPAQELLALDPGSIVVKSDNAMIQATLDIPFADQTQENDSATAGLEGGLQGDVRLTAVNGDFANGALSGGGQIHVPRLDFLSAFSTELQQISGGLEFDLRLNGTLQEPEPRGTLAIENAQLELATPGLAITNIDLTATGDASGQIRFKGGAESGGGKLTLNGESQWVTGTATDPGASPQLDNTQIQVVGSDFQMWNSSEARLWASPDITVSIVDNEVLVTGDIEVPRAQITPKELPQSAVEVSSDQIIILEDESSQERSGQQSRELAVRVRTKVILGDDVAIDGFGFKGRLKGTLAVRKDPDKPTTASGELNILDGEYRAYGQGLVVERGQILFAGGAIENPGLSIRALRRPDPDVVVGVNVKGQAKQPELRIFSEPAMSSSNQLSWLVLGRSFESTSDAESDYIAQAALIVGIQGGDYLAKGIGERLGLDNIGIETGSGEAGAASDVNQAALVVGKYLTPDLYISYGVGLLDSISTVKLRYTLSEHWNLITESSPIASGGDINYTFER